MISARLQLEKDYKTAMQKQEQKIELANRMYELVSRHIERLDSQVMTSSTLNKADWIKKAGPHQRTKRLDHHTNNGGIRKRIHHSSRPNPTLAAYHGGGGGGGGLNGMSSSTADMIDPNEPTYCYCNQVSFGDMIACDGENVSLLLLSRSIAAKRLILLNLNNSANGNGFIIVVWVW